jgi:hypothetical protein
VYQCNTLQEVDGRLPLRRSSTNCNICILQAMASDPLLHRSQPWTRPTQATCVFATALAILQLLACYVCRSVRQQLLCTRPQ